jgi:hypothetical protein
MNTTDGSEARIWTLRETFLRLGWFDDARREFARARSQKAATVSGSSANMAGVLGEEPQGFGV